MRAAHVGCSGWNYRRWRRVAYPQGLAPKHLLQRYAELFHTVEVNATFYRPLKPKRAALA